MGNTASNSKAKSDERVAMWRSTGIVAIRDAKLKALPAAVVDIGPKIRTLDASNNKIEELPPSIVVLQNLQRLVLVDNRLESIGAAIGKLASLKLLALDGNKLSGLPSEVGLLLRLEKLSLSRNCLKTLPDSLGKLKNLTLLNVSSNKLLLLPPTIGGCSSLEEVNADENELTSLPGDLASLKQLKSLSLDSNQIAKLPDNIFEGCEKLQTLSLQRNPISLGALEQMVGYAKYESRRKDKVNKQISGNVLMDSSALEEAIIRT